MDPRHPEQALPRVKELVKQYEDLEKRISKATVSSDLGQLEREGVLVVQELCLVAPRLHETLMNTSRQRRQDLAKWNGYVTRETIKSPLDNVAEAIVSQARGDESNRSVQVEYIEPKPEKKPAKKKPAKKGKK